MIATNIEWDTDENEDLLKKLPKEIEIPGDLTDTDDISNYLSKKTGFCHRGFNLKSEDEYEYIMPDYGNFENKLQQIRAEEEFDKEDLLEYFELQEKIKRLRNELDDIWLDSTSRQLDESDSVVQEMRNEISDLEETLESHMCNAWFEKYDETFGAEQDEPELD